MRDNRLEFDGRARESPHEDIAAASVMDGDVCRGEMGAGARQIRQGQARDTVSSPCRCCDG